MNAVYLIYFFERRNERVLLFPKKSRHRITVDSFRRQFKTVLFRCLVIQRIRDIIAESLDLRLTYLLTYLLTL